MENAEMTLGQQYGHKYKTGLLILMMVGTVAFMAGIFWARSTLAAGAAGAAENDKREPRVVYPKKTDLDFEGAAIEGEIKNPGEFYFQRRPDEKFDSLVKRRKNFHREMLRDVVLSK